MIQGQHLTATFKMDFSLPDGVVAPAVGVTFFACAKESNQRNTPPAAQIAASMGIKVNSDCNF